jgi:hypothetical protein
MPQRLTMAWSTPRKDVASLFGAGLFQTIAARSR